MTTSSRFESIGQVAQVSRSRPRKPVPRPRFPVLPPSQRQHHTSFHNPKRTQHQGCRRVSHLYASGNAVIFSLEGTAATSVLNTCGSDQQRSLHSGCSCFPGLKRLHLNLQPEKSHSKRRFPIAKVATMVASEFAHLHWLTINVPITSSPMFASRENPTPFVVYEAV